MTSTHKEPKADRIQREEKRLARLSAELRNWVPNSLYLYTYHDCIYCGDPAPTIDHVFPVALLTAQERTGGMHSRGVTVDSCRECNSAILGSKLFHSFHERLSFAAAGIARRHKKILNLPAWEASELREISGSLRALVEANQKARKLILRRLEWQDSSVFRDHITLIREQIKAEHPDNHRLQAYFAPHSS